MFLGKHLEPNSTKRLNEVLAISESAGGTSSQPFILESKREGRRWGAERYRRSKKKECLMDKMRETGRRIRCECTVMALESTECEHESMGMQTISVKFRDAMTLYSETCQNALHNAVLVCVLTYSPNSLATGGAITCISVNCLLLLCFFIQVMEHLQRFLLNKVIKVKL